MINGYRVKKAFLYLKARKLSLLSKDTIHSTFDSYKCIFIHVPKAAGSSISFSLFGHQVGHRSVKEYYMLSPRKVEDYFVFTFVRNPWSRFYSAYKFLQQGGMTKGDADFSKKYMTGTESVEEFAEKVKSLQLHRSVRHLMPQHEFLTWDGVNIGVNFIGRFEDLDSDFSKVRKRLGLEEGLRHVNAATETSGNDWRRHYSDESKSIIEEIYQRDIYLFGYEFGGER